MKSHNSTRTRKAPLSINVDLFLNRQTMTINELRAYPNCAHYTDVQAEDILRTLDKLATVIFDYTCHQYGIVVDNQLKVASKDISDSHLNIAA